MRTIIGLVAVAVLAGRAIADDEPKMTAGASLAVWLPSGDADEFTKTSLGVRPYFTYRVHRIVRVVASLDWIFVNEKSDAGVGDVTYYSVSAGARIFKPRPETFEPYGEVLVGWYRLESDPVEDSSLGFRLGGGVVYPIGTLLANGGISYSVASFDTGGLFSLDVDALVLDVGIGARF